LDVACGSAPYYEVYKPFVEEVICLDHPQGTYGIDHVDVLHDINAGDRLPFPSERFDTVLATDMLPQVKRPDLFVQEVSRILKPEGKVILSTSFVNWMGEYPNEYMHFSGPGLRNLATEASLKVQLIESYGGHTDVLLDTMNKYFPHGFGNRLFRYFAQAVNSTGWPARNRARTRDRYALGNVMVAVKSGS
jgi:SAM-dependent methyltransferase